MFASDDSGDLDVVPYREHGRRRIGRVVNGEGGGQVTHVGIDRACSGTAAAVGPAVKGRVGASCCREDGACGYCRRTGGTTVDAAARDCAYTASITCFGD